MDGLSHKVQLHQKHKHEGLTVITVNADGKESAEANLALLKKLNVNTVNWYIAEGDSEEAEAALQFDVFSTVNFYDRQGRFRHQLSGIVEDADVDSWVQKLLAE